MANVEFRGNSGICQKDKRYSAIILAHPVDKRTSPINRTRNKKIDLKQIKRQFKPVKSKISRKKVSELACRRRISFFQVDSPFSSTKKGDIYCTFFSPLFYLSRPKSRKSQ